MSIATEISRLQTAKSNIKASIENKGVTVPSDALLSTYNNYINQIVTGETSELQSKSVEITTNGTTNITPDSGYDGISAMTVVTNVASGYRSELLNVSISASDGATISPLTTVEFQTPYSANGQYNGDFSMIIPSGAVYTITFGVMGGYETPTAQTFTAGTSTRSIAVEYQAVVVDMKAVLTLSDSSTVNIPNNGSTELTQAELLPYTGTVVSAEIVEFVTSIGEKAFQYCSSLSSVTIPNSVTSIGEKAFYGGSSLSSVTIPNSVTSIGGSAFFQCTSLSSITIPNSVTSIGSGAFHYCTSLSSITIPSGLTSIEFNAFQNCSSLSSVTIPDSVTSIGSYAFYRCTSLSSVTIGSGVTSIGNYAFRDCSRLTLITCNAVSAPTIQSDTFYEVASNGTLYYPSGSDYTSWMSRSTYYLGYYSWTVALI